jgi:hypothetical protein
MITRILVSSLLFLGMNHPGTDPATGRVPATNSAEFSLVREENNIRVYSRWIPVDETRNVRQLKAEFTVDQPPEKVLERIHDDNHFCDWMKNTKTSYRVRTVDPLTWYSYLQFSVPWPLSNQDCILRYEVKRSSAPGEITVVVTGEPGFLREFEGVKRISHLEGEWILKETGPGRTRVVYLIFSKQPSRYPRRITDPIIQNNLLESMNAFCLAVNHE